jgi:hypothetical protein
MANIRMASGVVWLAGRSGSGDGEWKASMTRQMPSGPLPASVLFALVFWRNGNEREWGIALGFDRVPCFP